MVLKQETTAASAALGTPFHIPIITFAFALTSVLSDTSCHREMAFGTISTFQPLHRHCAPGISGTIFGTFDFVHVTNEKKQSSAMSRAQINRLRCYTSMLLDYYCTVIECV